MTSRNSLAIRRINKDIREITKNPIEGIGIASIDNDPMKYVINMRLMAGPYEGYCLQLLLTFSDNYPTKPPKILIYPEQLIDGNYHHHIFQDMSTDSEGKYYKKFCFDLLDNDFFHDNAEKTGWNPSYSISSLLMQVQNFISDPDMGDYIPPKYQIDELMKSMDNYTRTFNVYTENGIIKKVHTWKDPYPEMYFKKEEVKENNEDNVEESQNKQKEQEERKMQIIKENLSCFMLKLNYIDDPGILLGYPIIQKKGQFGKNKIELFPIPELLSYDGFQTQIGVLGLQGLIGNFNYIVNNQLKSANNEFYNNWIPIYINKEHYEKNKTTILNAFTRITNENFGILNYQFKPEQIFQVLPIILNSMIIGMYSGKTTLSSSYIRCYFQFILLFKKLSQEFEGEYLDYLNTKLDEIKKNNYVVNKKIIPDIGNFFILLLFCSFDTNSEKMKKIYYSLYEDTLIRQMFWMFHSEENREEMKKTILKSRLKEICLKKFEENANFKMNKLDKFNQDLKELGLFDQVVDIISNDKTFLDHIFIGKDRIRGQVVTRMTKSFKRLFNECSKEGKEKLGEIIINNLDFPSYFDDKQIDDSGLYDNYKVDELLKNSDIENKDEIVAQGFKNQKGNKLLIITFFAQNKVKEEGFLEELEKNYGVYLDVDNFIKEMNQKLDEIKSYKDLYEYIGSEFGRDKSDYDLILEAYEKAKEKGYIRSINNSLSSSFFSQNLSISGAIPINNPRNILYHNNLGNSGRFSNRNFGASRNMINYNLGNSGRFSNRSHRDRNLSRSRSSSYRGFSNSQNDRQSYRERRDRERRDRERRDRDVERRDRDVERRDRYYNSQIRNNRNGGRHYY